MTNKKTFTSNILREIFYQVMEEGWLDDSTYLIVFQNMTDVDGDTFHLEVEYHKDEDKITYTRVYDFENVDGSYYISPIFKKQIDEYILGKVGICGKDSMLVTQNITIGLKLVIPNTMTVGELDKYLSELEVKVNSPYATDAKVWSVENKGKIK